MPNNSCKTCAAYAALRNECRVKSPTVVIVQTPQGPKPAGVFPAVAADSWCLDWRPEPPQIQVER